MMSGLLRLNVLALGNCCCCWVGHSSVDSLLGITDSASSATPGCLVCLGFSKFSGAGEENASPGCLVLLGLLLKLSEATEWGT